MAEKLKDKRGKLQLSRLESQTQLLQKDLDLKQLKLVSKRLPGFRFEEAVIGGEVNRTIEGASTVSITVNDRFGYIRRSGRLGAAVDIQLDGLWFRLVKVTKSGNNLTLVFESREVAILRTYNKFRASAWGLLTRTRFAQILVNEVKEFKIPFICPELKKRPAENKDKKRRDQRAKDRDMGILDWTDAIAAMRSSGKPVTIKDKKPRTDQILNVGTILDAGDSMPVLTDSLGRPLKTGVRRKLQVCAIMTAITESSITNLNWGDPNKKGDPLEKRKTGSVGVFQQLPGWGTYKERMNVTHAARRFFMKAISIDKAEPNLDYGELCQKVQVSAFPDRYQLWRIEAERWVTVYGMAGGDNHKNSDIAAANNMGDWQQASGNEKYQYMRGRPKSRQDPNGEKEDTWTCLQRLAEEVQWRCFEVSGEIYFISEPRLFKSASRATISEESDGVDWIDFDYDVGKKNSTITITARVDRWLAPPGSIITINNSGVINGRWLVSEIHRPLFDPLATITCKKPRAKLPEPKREDLGNVGDIKTKKEYEPTPGFEPDPPNKLPHGNELRKAVLGWEGRGLTFIRASQRNDIQFGVVKGNLLRFMLNFLEAGFPIRVTALKTDHDKFVAGSSRVSNHYLGLAIDMGNYTNGDMAKATNAQMWIRNRLVQLKIDELIGPDDTLTHGGPYDIDTLNAHKDHIHVAVIG